MLLCVVFSLWSLCDWLGFNADNRQSSGRDYCVGFFIQYIIHHSILQVQEEFALGLGEIHRARAAEKVTSRTTKAVGAAANATMNSVHEFDSKMKISERANQAVGAMKESSVMQQTGIALTKAGSTVRQATAKVMEQPAVASAAETVNSGFRKLTASLSSMTGRAHTMGQQQNYDGGATVNLVSESREQDASKEEP